MSESSRHITWLHYVEYAAVRIIRAILLALPVDVGVAILAKIWRYAARLEPRHKRAIRHMSWALDIQEGSPKLHQLAADMWENIGRTFAEALILDRLAKDPSRFSCKSSVYHDGWAVEKDGAIVVTHHFGNWELAGVPALGLHDRNVLSVYKRLSNPLTEAFLKSIRATIYRGGLFNSQDEGVFRAADYLRAGGDIALVTDLRDNNGIVVKFFGMPMEVSPLAAILARRMNKPLYVAQMRRVENSRFELDMKKVAIPDSEDPRDDIQQTMVLVFDQFEEWIRENPAQFMWAPYRWTGRRDKAEKPQFLPE